MEFRGKNAKNSQIYVTSDNIHAPLSQEKMRYVPSHNIHARRFPDLTEFVDAVS